MDSVLKCDEAQRATALRDGTLPQCKRLKPSDNHKPFRALLVHTRSGVVRYLPTSARPAPSPGRRYRASGKRPAWLLGSARNPGPTKQPKKAKIFRKRFNVFE